MRFNLRGFALLASILVLGGCADGSFSTIIGPIVAGGPELSFRGTVRSSLTGEPIQGAKIRLYAPGDPFEFPYTAASAQTSVGGAYLLRLPASLGLGDNCEVWRLSARAVGFEANSEIEGVLCTTETQEFDFFLTPVVF